MILCPSDVSAAVVAYLSPTATDNSNETPTVECEPPIGFEFDIGKTNVTCVARDNSGNNSTCHFQVEVLGKFKPHLKSI